MDSDIEDKRKLAVFSDDLFRYLLHKRFNIEELCPPLRRPNDPTTSSYPVVGLSILCISHSKQKEYFKYFAKHLPVILKEFDCLEVENYGRFCVVANDYFNSKFENIYEKLINLGCLVLELSAFCDVQGFKHFKYFSSNIWADMIYRKYGIECLSKDGWDKLVRFASDSVEAYTDKNREICTDQNNRTDFKTEKLREFDTWASMLSADTLQGICTFGIDPPRLKFAPNRINPVELMHKDILVRFLGSIIEDADPATEEFFNYIKNLGHTIKVMNNELYLQVMVEMIKILGMKMRSFDLLQLAKLVVADNKALATFCFLTIQYAYGYRSEQDVMNIYSIISGEMYHLNSQSSVNVKPPKDSPVKSTRKTGAISKVIPKKAAVNEVSNKRLLREFKRVIERNNDMIGREICKYFKLEPKSSLLDNIVFKKLMELTWQHSENRWENIWILSLMKSLEPSVKTNLNFGISVFRNLTLLDPEVLAETLMGELVKRKNDLFKFPDIETTGIPKYKSIIPDDAETMNFPGSKDFSEASCEAAIEHGAKLKGKRLTAKTDDVECPQPKAQTRETLDKTSSLKENTKKNINENKLLENEFVKEKKESKRARTSSVAERLFHNKQALVPQERVQPNITEKSELISFPNLEMFIGQYFHTFDPNDLRKKPEDSDSYTVITSDALKSVVGVMDAKKGSEDNMNVDNSVEKVSKLVNESKANINKVQAEEKNKVRVNSEALIPVDSESSTAIASEFPGNADIALYAAVAVADTKKDKDDNMNADNSIEKTNSDISETISSNSKLVNEFEDREIRENLLAKLNKLEDLKTRMEMVSDENRMKNLSINEKETDKVESGVTQLDPIRESPNKFQTDQQKKHDENLQPDSIVTSQISPVTDSQSSHTSDASHSKDILTSTEQNYGTSDVSLPQNLERISPDILAAYRNVMDLLQIEDSVDVFNGTLQQIVENNPDALKTLKVKSIIDKQIKKELLKYHDRYHEIRKGNEQISGHGASQDKSSVQSEL